MPEKGAHVSHHQEASEAAGVFVPVAVCSMQLSCLKVSLVPVAANFSGLHKAGQQLRRSAGQAAVSGCLEFHYG